MNRTCHEAFQACVARVRANEALDTYQRDQRENLWLDLIQSLGAFDIRVLGHVRGEIIVNDARPMAPSAWWLICDNGGELNVERVNDHESLRSVPYTNRHHSMIDGATMAYRVRCVLDDSPIDYGLSLTVHDCREALGPNA